jgi:hypothetical protein
MIRADVRLWGLIWMRSERAVPPGGGMSGRGLRGVLLLCVQSLLPQQPASVNSREELEQLGHGFSAGLSGASGVLPAPRRASCPLRRRRSSNAIWLPGSEALGLQSREGIRFAQRQARAVRPTPWCADEDAEAWHGCHPHGVEPAGEHFARIRAYAPVHNLWSCQIDEQVVCINLRIDRGEKQKRSCLAVAPGLVLNVVNDQPVRGEPPDSGNLLRQANPAEFTLEFFEQRTHGALLRDE